MKKSISIVWFKRDLRLEDHAPLHYAIHIGNPVILLYIFEPEIMSYKDSDMRHWRFVYESLMDMNRQLIPFNSKIQLLYGNCIQVFEDLIDAYSIEGLYSHEETGNHLTFQRDKDLGILLKKHHILWKEFQTNGVIRKLKHREKWNESWLKTMTQPCFEIQLAHLKIQGLSLSLQEKYSIDQLSPSIQIPDKKFQPGGSSFGWKYLRSFLNERHDNYSFHISKPALSRTSCGRISPYLSFGCLSLRQVYQETQKAYSTSKSKRSLSAFIVRLHWRDHFIQKFETECRMEFENLNRGYDRIVKTKNERYIKAWEQGRTGVPLVDATMRCLAATGYVNFRMRAMVVSFFCYNLWQDWRDASYLARVFLDYEPGIHYPQKQMQSGVTGINTVRIYNPIKNAMEHDVDGTFVRTWVPELQQVPIPLLFEPWKMTEIEQKMYQCILDKDYPMPIVSLEETRKYATETIWSMRKDTYVMKENQRILKIHVKQKRPNGESKKV